MVQDQTIQFRLFTSNDFYPDYEHFSYFSKTTSLFRKLKFKLQDCNIRYRKLYSFAKNSCPNREIALHVLQMRKVSVVSYLSILLYIKIDLEHSEGKIVNNSSTQREVFSFSLVQHIWDTVYKDFVLSIYCRVIFITTKFTELTTRFRQLWQNNVFYYCSEVFLFCDCGTYL